VSKYHAKKTVVDGIIFQSRKEAKRYQELKLMQRAGLISDLRRQVKYELIPKQQGERAVSYIADFVYTEDGKTVVEDVKGVRTPVYKIKKKLMLWRHGVKIREV
jgi:hypothetical protein